jgi:hypothetical protein
MTQNLLNTGLRVARRRFRSMAATALLVACLPGAALAAEAGLIPAYPGVYPIYVMNVKDARSFHVNAAVWPGFQREFDITMPGVDIPSDSIKAPACEQALAAKAKAFTEAFFKKAERPELHNIAMADTTKEAAVSEAFSEEGSLIEALIAKGYARPSTTEASTPWCED